MYLPLLSLSSLMKEDVETYCLQYLNFLFFFFRFCAPVFERGYFKGEIHTGGLFCTIRVSANTGIVYSKQIFLAYCQNM